MSSLAGKTVVVIGGSSGIGLATARAAAAEGARVVIASRQPGRAEIDADRAVVDVTDEVSVRTFFGGLGPLDHLVCSTVARAGGPLAQLDLDAARLAFETKLWGPLTAIRHARLAADGSVTLLSGVAAWTPMAGGVATAAVNGAVAAAVRTLAVELAPVRVNAVSPGIVDTPTWAGLPEERRAEMFGRLAERLPAGRVGRPEELAEAILFLMGNGFVTGTVLHVEGGHRLTAP